MLIIQVIPGTSPSESIRLVFSGEVEGCQAHVELHVRIGVPFEEGIGLVIEDGPDRKLQLCVDVEDHSGGVVRSPPPARNLLSTTVADLPRNVSSASRMISNSPCSSAIRMLRCSPSIR